MYREVTMFEVTEALRLWLSGTPQKRIAAQLGLDGIRKRFVTTSRSGPTSGCSPARGSPRRASATSCWRSSRAEDVRAAIAGATA